MNRTATIITRCAVVFLVFVPATADERIPLIETHSQAEELEELTQTHPMHPFALIHIS